MDSILIKIFLPVSLAVIMFGMGLDLVKADFSRVLQKPKAVLAGFVSQFVGLPLLGLLTISLFQLDTELAVGLMILSFCPGGVVSNVYSYLSKADIGLSITLTALTGLLSPFTVPLFSKLYIEYASGQAQTIPFPVLKTMGTLIVVIILPVLIGMTVKRRNHDLARSLERFIRPFSIFSLVVIIFAVIYDVREHLFDYLGQAGPASITLNVLAMLFGLLVARLLKLERRQAITISLEIGLQNAATAILITATLMKNTKMAMTPSAYGLLMFFSAAALVVVVRRFFRE